MKALQPYQQAGSNQPNEDREHDVLFRAKLHSECIDSERGIELSELVTVSDQETLADSLTKEKKNMY